MKSGVAAQGPGPMTPAALRRAVSALRGPVDPATAQHLRTEASRFRFSDPSLYLELSEALLRAVQEGVAGEPGPATTLSLAIAWFLVADAQTVSGRLTRAERAFLSATEFAEKTGDGELLGQILVARVHGLALAGRAAESARLAGRAERLLRRSGQKALLGKLAMNRGNALYQQDRYRAADREYARAERLFGAAELRDANRVGLLMNRAVIATNLERLPAARVMFRRADAMARQGGFDFLGAFARFNQAHLEAVSGDFRAAFRLLDEAEAVFVAQEAEDMAASVLRTRGEIYLELGMPADARDFFRDATRRFEGAGLELDAALGRLDEARSLIELGAARDAVPVLEAAADMFRRRRNRPRRALARFHLGEAELTAGRPAQALSHGGTALDVFRALRMDRWAARTLLLQARCRLEMGDAAAAETLWKQVRTRVKRLSLPHQQDFWTLGGRVSRALGNRPVARRRFARAAELLESSRRFIPGVEFRSRTFDRMSGAYRGLLDLELEAPRFERLLELTERARARGFRDRSRLRGGGTREVRERRAILGSLTHRLEEAEFAAEPDRSEAIRLGRRVLALEQELLRAERRRQERGRPGNSEPIAPAEDLRMRLRPGQGAVTYSVVGDRVLALGLTRSGGGYRLLSPSTSELQGLLDRARFHLESGVLAGKRGNVGFLRRSAESSLRPLFDALLAPLLDLIPESGELRIAPDGFLHHVPFECLWDGEGYIGERWTLSRIPHLGFPRRRKRRRSRRSVPRVWICGVSKTGPGFVPQELEAIREVYPRRGVKVLDETSTGELQSILSEADALHLTTHGIFRDDNPAFSRLNTSDGALFLADVLESRLRAELVVLSACNTGRVFTGGGSDLSGLAHAFLAAGAQSLVASLWRVDDEATQVLMSAFHRAYRRSKRRDAAHALRMAGVEVRARWDHPALWGGFAVFGG